MDKKSLILALRGIRKTSYLTNRIVKKGSHFLDRVERKTSRILITKTGSLDNTDSVTIDNLVYHSIHEITPVHPALPSIDQKPSVTVFAFLDPRGFYGGIATLLCVGAALANELGYDFRVAQTTNFSDSTDVLDFLKSKGITIDKSRFSTVNLSKRSPSNFGYLPLHQDDVLVVSTWWDAYIAQRLPLQRKFLYLIQDYEPIFYNNSDKSVLAEQTYHSEKFIPLMNTEILYKYFVSKNYDYITKNAIWFEPAPGIIKDSSETSKKNDKVLFLYARPNVDRNLFINSMRALDLAFQDESMKQDSWKLFSAGTTGVPSVKLTSGHIVKNLGKMSIEDYYKFANTVDLALSPMLAPHPNYPTLELASLGALVVSTKWETKQSLSNYSANILMADPTPEDMAQKLIKASRINDSERTKNFKNNHINTDWPSALKEAIIKVAEQYK